MSNIKKEIKSLKYRFNDIGLWADTDICRLIGFAESEEDYYYILMFPSFIGEKSKIQYSSMVGPFVSLKRKYRRYKQLEYQMTNVWNCPPQPKFRVEKIKE